MTKALQDTVALVTGASSGIGEAAARAPPPPGGAGAAGGAGGGGGGGGPRAPPPGGGGAAPPPPPRRKDRLDALTAEIGGLAIETDVTDREQAVGAVERTVQELGRLDIVINNAGVMLLGEIVDAPVQEWDRMIALNLQGLLYVAHAALPHLLAAARQESRRVADLVNV